MISVSGKIKEIGYFFKGYRNTRASKSVIQNAMWFMTGLALSPKKTLVGICQVISGRASQDQLRKFLDNPRTRRQLRRLMDDKERALFLTALKRNHNYLYSIYLMIDATFMGRHSTTMEDLFFVGKGAKKVGNHVFLVGLLILHDGTRIPLRPRLQKTKKTAKGNYKTQVDIVGEIVRSVSFRKGLIVVADSYFLSTKFTDIILEMGHHFVIAAKCNRVVVEGNVERQLQDYVVDENILCRLRKITLETFGSGGQHRSKYYSACKRLLHLKDLGEVAVVFSRRYKKRGAELKMFVSDLVDASVEELVEHYDLRWEIEVFFREMKSLLGFEACRMQSSAAHENWGILVCLTFLHLQGLSQKHQGERWGPRGYRGQPRMSDYLQLHSLLVQRKNVEHLLRAGATHHDRRRILQHFAIPA